MSNINYYKIEHFLNYYKVLKDIEDTIREVKIVPVNNKYVKKVVFSLFSWSILYNSVKFE